MTPFLWYQLKAGVCLMLFTGLYYVLFRKETFHRFNRFYLVSTMLLSALIPAIQFPSLSAENIALSEFIKEVTIYAYTVSPAAALATTSESILRWVYLVISLSFFGYLLYQLVTLIVLISRRKITTLDGFRIIIVPEKALSFSFFNLLFLNAPVTQTDIYNPVLQHEMAHARQGHSLDIMLVQIIKIFQWFNPFVYLMEKALKETHEYLADEAVLEHDSQSDQYRVLLLAQVFGVQPGIFSFFNYSLIKNRLTMMTKEKSPLRNRLKYLAALPLVVLLGLLMCCMNIKSQEPVKSSSSKETKAIAVEIIASDEKPSDDAKGEPIFVEVEVPAQFQGGNLEAFREWVQKNVVYPPLAIKNGIFGKVIAQFSIDSKGKVCDVKILRGVDPSLDEETYRVIKLSPDWTPAKQGGKNVKQQFVMPVAFALTDKK